MSSAPELDLLTEWHIWIFYFDDHFLKVYTGSRDLAGAREHVDRLASLMPVEPVGAAPVPATTIRWKPAWRLVAAYRPAHARAVAAPVFREHPGR